MLWCTCHNVCFLSYDLFLRSIFQFSPSTGEALETALSVPPAPPFSLSHGMSDGGPVPPPPPPPPLPGFGPPPPSGPGGVAPPPPPLMGMLRMPGPGGAAPVVQKLPSFVKPKKKYNPETQMKRANWTKVKTLEH